ncbi:zinc finger protein 211-like [Maniola jurtina]|uniref:zinc finger protein 211-like n=1 Tax=Maniola jurtina TaxID=191418 RepID=UPI001E68B9CB|nr:zinc finger protein 211-like [Maniola jurtina]
MDDICRLCCSSKFVNNYIFDDENALFVKMSLYLPIKVFRDDKLPQKICDRCSCKVNDFYQFCNETIEVQNRLKGLLQANIPVNRSVDLTVIKQDTDFPAPVLLVEKSTQTDSIESVAGHVKPEPVSSPRPSVSPSVIKKENYDSDDFASQDVPSDDSEDELLIELKKKKRGRKPGSRNGEVKEIKRGRKKKEKHVNWDLRAKGNGQVLTDNGFNDTVVVKQELDYKTELSAVLLGVKCKQEGAYCCCMCFEECSTRPELLLHYQTHARKAEADELAPPPALGDSPRCLRCQKVVPASQWADHWRRHYARDIRPYHCAVCFRAFRDHYQILKHGLTHTAEELRADNDGAEDANADASQKRFACDVCSEGFVYMRCLLSHRTRSHPEAAGRALRLRCAVCARTFAHANSLRRHLRVHSGERNFLCSVCGKALSSREHLKFHLRIHTGYKPNVCKTCGKGFVKKCNLTLHERVHSGEKPHVCSHCGKAFSQRSTLVIHERYHSGARPYSCGMCGRGFVAKGLLSMHLKSACVTLPTPANPPGPPHQPIVTCHRLSSR